MQWYEEEAKYVPTEYNDLFVSNEFGEICFHGDDFGLASNQNNMVLALLDNDVIPAGSDIYYGDMSGPDAIMEFMDETRFAELLSGADPAYTFDGLLRAVERFPSICAGLNFWFDQVEGCKLEMATLFAAIYIETSTEYRTVRDHADFTWEFNDHLSIVADPDSTEKFRGRGPLMMEGEY